GEPEDPARTARRSRGDRRPVRVPGLRRWRVPHRPGVRHRRRRDRRRAGEPVDGPDARGGLAMKSGNGGAPAAAGVLRGKVAVITGAASGIGRASAILFGREGAAVVLFDREEEGGLTVARAIEDEGGRALFVHGDVTRDADAERAVNETTKRFGRLDILFNNAGIIRRATLLETSEEDW